MCYLFVEIIMNITANMAINMPMMMLLVSASPKTKVPTRMAVIGSNTPSTEAFVAPIFRVATANVAVDTIVGRMASPIRLSQARLLSMPAIISVFDRKMRERNMVAPTNRV